MHKILPTVSLRFKQAKTAKTTIFYEVIVNKLTSGTRFSH